MPEGSRGVDGRKVTNSGLLAYRNPSRERKAKPQISCAPSVASTRSRLRSTGILACAHFHRVTPDSSQPHECASDRASACAPRSWRRAAATWGNRVPQAPDLRLGSLPSPATPRHTALLAGKVKSPALNSEGRGTLSLARAPQLVATITTSTHHPSPRNSIHPGAQSRPAVKLETGLCCHDHRVASDAGLSSTAFRLCASCHAA